MTVREFRERAWLARAAMLVAMLPGVGCASETSTWQPASQHALSSGTAGTPSQALPARVIPVEVVIDSRLAMHPLQRHRIDAALGVVRRVFEDQFAINFRMEVRDDWDRRMPVSEDNWERGWRELMNAARTRESIVVGITGWASTEDGRTERSDARATVLGRFVLIRWPWERAAFGELEHAMLHEFGHLFGAWHSQDLHSVMSTWREGPDATRFDELSAAVIRMTRDRDLTDFRSLGERRLSEIRRLFASNLPADGRANPISSALLNLAWEAVGHGNPELAASLARQALGVVTEDTPGDRNAIEFYRMVVEQTETGCVERARATGTVE